jgi:hypothetical protein
MSLVTQEIVQAMLAGVPKAALGALIPVAQYAWKTWSDRNAPTQAAKLLGELKGIEEAADGLGDSGHAERLREYVRTQRALALAKLLAVRPTGSAEVALPPPQRSRWQRWFLLYAPARPWAWVLHIAFFICAVFVAIGFVTMLGFLNDPDTVLGMAIGFGFFALTGLALRAWAALVDDVSTIPEEIARARRTRLQRWLVLYRPSSLSAIVVHVLFYTLILMLAFAIVGVAADWGDSDDNWLGVLGLSFFVLVPAALASIANLMDRRTNTAARAAAPPQNESAASA